MNFELQRINDENIYLKEEIKQVENVAIAQQSDLQNKYLQEIE